MGRSLPLLSALSLLAAIPSPSPGAPPITLRLVAYYYGVDQDNLEALAREFNASHPGIVVRYQRVPFAELRRHLQVANVSGDMPDVAIVDNPDHASLAEAGLLVDLTDRLQRWSGSGKFYAGPWSSTIYRGRNYGIPFTTNCLGLIYDKKALASAGVRVPETWGELREAARKLTRPGRHGFAAVAARSEEGTFQFLPWLVSAGGDVTRLDSAAAIRALAFLRRLIDDGSMSAEVVNLDQSDIQRLFSAGKVAMMTNGPWTLPQLGRDATDPDFQYGIAPIPRDQRYATPLGGENVAITRHANVEAAWTFVEWLTSREVMERFARRSGHLPPRVDVARAKGAWSGDPRLRPFIEMMPHAVPRGPHPRWPELSEVIASAVQDGLSGARSPADALQDAQRRLVARGLAPAAPGGVTNGR